MKKPKKDIDFKYNFKTYWSFLRKYKSLVAILLFFVLLLEVSYTVDKFIFKVIIDNGTEFMSGTLLRGDYISILWIVLVVFICVIIMRYFVNFLKIHFLNILDSHLMRDLKRRFFNHIIHLSHRFHSSHKTGSMISRVIRGSKAIEGMTDVIVFNAAPLIFQLIVVFSAIVYFDATSAFVVVITVAIFIGYSVYMQNKQKVFGALKNKQEDDEKAYISDIMMNIDSIKYFGKERRIKSKFNWFTEKTRRMVVKYWNFYRWLDGGQTLILGTGLLLLIYFPMIAFLNSEITIGTLVFIYTIFSNLYGPLFSFVWGIRRYYEAMVDFEDIFYYGKIENDIKDLPDAKDLKIRKGEIEFKNVTFGYDKKRKIFRNFSLKIKPHERVAFVGHSGCGKTTLVNLLYRLYDVDQGQILIDGKDIREFKQESLREELSIVPQECVLFDETIFNNIGFSKPGAKKNEVFKAMKFSQIDRVINGFPKKENTIVGERGVKLSGGEKQRVSIARAILADKNVLVLDEATSALDSETEHEIQRDLLKLIKGRTSIMIAHRLSTIMHANKIVVLKKGKIVEMGSHKSLLKKRKGEYRKLWNLQKGGYIK